MHRSVVFPPYPSVGGTIEAYRVAEVATKHHRFLKHHLGEAIARMFWQDVLKILNEELSLADALEAVRNVIADPLHPLHDNHGHTEHMLAFNEPTLTRETPVDWEHWNIASIYAWTKGHKLRSLAIAELADEAIPPGLSLTSLKLYALMRVRKYPKISQAASVALHVTSAVSDEERVTIETICQILSTASQAPELITSLRSTTQLSEPEREMITGLHASLSASSALSHEDRSIITRLTASLNKIKVFATKTEHAKIEILSKVEIAKLIATAGIDSHHGAYDQYAAAMDWMLIVMARTAQISEAQCRLASERVEALMIDTISKPIQALGTWACRWISEQSSRISSEQKLILDTEYLRALQRLLGIPETVTTKREEAKACLRALSRRSLRGSPLSTQIQRTKDILENYLAIFELKAQLALIIEGIGKIRGRRFQRDFMARIRVMVERKLGIPRDEFDTEESWLYLPTSKTKADCDAMLTDVSREARTMFTEECMKIWTLIVGAVATTVEAGDGDPSVRGTAITANLVRYFGTLCDRLTPAVLAELKGTTDATTTTTLQAPLPQLIKARMNIHGVVFTDEMYRAMAAAIAEPLEAGGVDVGAVLTMTSLREHTPSKPPATGAATGAATASAHAGVLSPLMMNPDLGGRAGGSKTPLAKITLG